MSRTPHSGGSGKGSNGSDVMRNSFTVPPMMPFNNADASLAASVLHSPTQSCVEMGFNNVVFSRNGSFTGSAGGDGPASAAASAVTSRGPRRSSEHGGEAAAGGEQEDGPVVKVNPMPAIVGYFGMMFGGGIGAFYSQILRAKGFKPYQIGILAASNPVLSMTLLPTLSYLADKFRCEIAMMLSCIVLTSVSTVAFTVAGPPYLVILFFLIMTASHIVMNPLLDQQTLMMFPKQGRSSAWSYVRSYGAYGWGIGSLVASLIYKMTESWLAVSMQYLVGQLGLVYCMLVAKPYETIEKVPVRFKEVLHLLAHNKRVMLFLFAATMMGTGYSFIDNFLFLFLDDLGGSKVLMGLTVVLTVSTEIPLFQMSERLHKMFSERSMMTIAMGVWTFRVVCYSLLRNPWWVLLIEPLHGVTFAFMWLPSVHLIARAFPPKLSSSATGVLFTFTSGVGPTIGNLVAGTLYSLVGPRRMFLFAATVMGLSLAFYLAMDHMLERRGVAVVCDYDAAERVAAATDVTVAGDSDAHPRGGIEDAGAPCKAKASASHASTVRRSARLQPAREGVHGGRQQGMDVVEDDLPK